METVPLVTLLGVIVTLSGGLLWVVKKLFESTIPNLIEQNQEDRDKYMESLVSQQTLFKDEMDTNRDLAMQVHAGVMVELRGVTSACKELAQRVERGQWEAAR